MAKKFIQEIADHVTRLDSDPEVSILLAFSVGRVLMNIHNSGGDWQKATREVDLPHIVDWLRAAVFNRSDWLRNVDGKGRPKKLLKFADLRGIAAEADKSMRIQSQGAALVNENGHEELVMEVGNGMYVVRLLSPEALDRESQVMQHCIGNGGYDARLASGDFEYLSLRDVAGHPHATMEISKKAGKVHQLQGKQNRRPLDRYLLALAPLYKQWRNAGVSFQSVIGDEWIVDHEGVLHHYSALPPKLVVPGDLELAWTRSLRLPDEMTILGNLRVKWNSMLALPNKLEVRGDLIFEDDWGDFQETEEDGADEWYDEIATTDRQLASFPSNLVVGGNLRLDKCMISSVINKIKVGGKLELNGIGGNVAFQSLKASHLVLADMDWVSLPVEMEVTHLDVTNCPNLVDLGDLEGIEMLSMRGMPIEAVPYMGTLRELHLRDMPIREFPGITATDSLTLTRTDITELPKALILTGTLAVHDTPIQSLPTGLAVGNLDLSGTEISSLPKDMTVSASITLWGENFNSLDGLHHVKGDLHIIHTSVQELPAGLRVDGDVRADRSILRSIGRDVLVGGHLNLAGCPISEIPDDIKVGNGLNLEGTRVRWLPDHLDVGSSLSVANTPILEIPKGLRITYLNIQDTDIVELPTGMDLDALDAARSHVYEIPAGVTVRYFNLSRRDDEIYARTQKRQSERWILEWQRETEEAAAQMPLPNGAGRLPNLPFG
jgi:hypothetical protein